MDAPIQQQPGYGAPPQGHAPPPQGYDAPPPQGYDAPPPQGYGAPPQGYGAPPQGYGAPPQGYGAPPQGYGAPPQGYGAPPHGYDAPPQGYGPPLQSYGAPPQGAQNMVPVAQAPPGCPPGLQYLAMVDQLLVKQQVELLEAFTGFETANKYKVLNSLGQDVFYAKEDTDCCTRQCCGPSRPFDMDISDNSGMEAIHLSRPLRCQSCLCFCCLQSMEVSSPPGTVVGSIEQNCTFIYPSFTIKDENESPVLKIEGPLCTIACCGDVEFKVVTLEGQEVGQIKKQWTGMLKEALTDADNFSISFPLDLDVKVKATLLGALFLIDFMYFETQNHNDN